MLIRNCRTKSQRLSMMRKLTKETEIIIIGLARGPTLDLIPAVSSVTLIPLKNNKNRKIINLKVNLREAKNTLIDKQRRCKNNLLNFSPNTLRMSAKLNRKWTKSETMRRIEKSKILRKRKGNTCKRKDNKRGEKEFKNNRRRRETLL